MARAEIEREDSAALTTTRIAVATDNADFAPLVHRIGELRQGRRGAPELWVRRLEYRNDGELAAAILYHVIRARLWSQTSSHSLPPFLSTISAALGADLVGLETIDRDEPLKVGCQLLGIAEEVGLIEMLEGPRGDKRVALTDPTFKRLKRIVNGAAAHVYVRVTAKPPAGVETKKPHEMRIARPDAPLRVVEAADKVQGTPWRINRAVLEVLGDVDEELRAELNDQLSDGQKLQREMIVAEARLLASLERFYFPGFLDFRGRLYQESDALSYTSGEDYARGLLEFADGEFVDEDGIKWLAWHAAQMWGEKRLPFGDGTSWLRQAAALVDRWRKAKHPAQFLAAALALVDAHEGRPVHLPVRVDATCSGMQHLALLLRDEELARLVNIWGDYRGDRRGMAWLEMPREPDFYDRVAEAVPTLTEGKERAEAKCVIVPVIYGAGSKTLARKLAEERRGDGARSRKEEERDVAAIIAAAKTFAPHEFALLAWFGAVAEAHNEAGCAVRWTTPAGFEAIQDYRFVEKNPQRPDRQVKVRFNGVWVNLVKRFYTRVLDKPQQALSLPSSIVHSMDAALLTEIVAGSRIDRWAVAHDAFAVPPTRVWELLQANEDAMRTLYAVDRLAEWMTAWRAAGIDVPDPPAHDAELPREMLGGLRSIG